MAHNLAINIQHP